MPSAAGGDATAGLGNVIGGLYLFCVGVAVLVRMRFRRAAIALATLAALLGARDFAVAAYVAAPDRNLPGLLIPAFLMPVPFIAIGFVLELLRQAGHPVHRAAPPTLLVAVAAVEAVYWTSPGLFGPPATVGESGPLAFLAWTVPLWYAALVAALGVTLKTGAPNLATRSLMAAALGFALPPAFLGTSSLLNDAGSLDYIKEPTAGAVTAYAALALVVAATVWIRLFARAWSTPDRRLADVLVGLTAAAVATAAGAALFASQDRGAGTVAHHVLLSLWQAASISFLALAVLDPWRRAAPTGERFRVERELGHGASGRAVLAHDTVLDRPVVLKHPSVGWFYDKRSEDLFLREARLLARIRHPNVVAVHEVRVEDRPPALVLEYVSGGSLEQKLEREGKLPLAEAARIMSDVLAGLAEVHRAGIVHRDLKPGNILLDDQGAAKVSDFGIARPPAEAGGAATVAATQFQPGSPAYMSPEQARGEEVDAGTDIYAAAAVLFRARTGRHYLDFEGKSEFKVRQLIQDGKPRFDAAEIPAPVADVLARGLAKRPSQRFPSAKEMRDALSAAVETATPSPPRPGPAAGGAPAKSSTAKL